jgi:molybdenum cofactor cytidylyltransferase
MGARNKLLIDVDGQPLVRRSASLLVAAGFIPLVVLGHEAERIRAALEGLPVRTVVNPNPSEGQVSSVRCGLRAARPEVDGVLVALSDQPRLRVEDVVSICDAFFRRGAAHVVIPTHGGRRGNPILLDRIGVSRTLCHGRGFGCRQFIERHRDQVTTVACGPGVVLDVDHPEDLALLSED